MSASGLEIRYWVGPVSIGADRPYDRRPYKHLHRMPPLVLFAAALVVNVAFAILLLFGSQPPSEAIAAMMAGDPGGSVLEIHLINQPLPQAEPLPAPGRSPRRQRPDEDQASEPKSMPAFAPEQRASGDVMDITALRAIYRRQLQARLERTRPPPTIMDSMQPGPRCRVIVDQDADGRIIELRVLACSGSPMWRDALLSSIRSAAPLPMPPYAALHSRHLEIDVSDVISVRLMAVDETAGEPPKVHLGNST